MGTYRSFRNEGHFLKEEWLVELSLERAERRCDRRKEANRSGIEFMIG